MYQNFLVEKTYRKVKSPSFSGDVEKLSTSLSLLRYFAIFLRKILFPRKAVFHTKRRENNVCFPNHVFILIQFFSSEDSDSDFSLCFNFCLFG